MSQPSKESMIRKQVFVAPKAADTTSVHAAITTAAVVTTGITNPDVPRTLRIVSGGADHDAAGTVTFTGTDGVGKVITEDIILNGNTPVDGLKAFKTVTKIDASACTAVDATGTIAVGLGASLGLDCECDAYSFSGFNGTAVTSYTYDLAEISLNVVLLAATLDGATDQVIFYVPDTFLTGRKWG